MSGSRENDDIPVYIDIRGDNRKVVDSIVDVVLRRVLEEEDEAEVAANSRAPSTASSTPSPLSINQLLSSSFSQPSALPAPMALNPFQFALCQSLVAHNTLPFPVFGGPSPLLPLFVPPPQPTVESVELLRIFQNILAKQKN